MFVFFWKTKQKFYKHEPEHDKSTRNKRREKKEKREKRKEEKRDWEQTRERGVAGEGQGRGGGMGEGEGKEADDLCKVTL